uniref:Uncharacterized protein n=1 Tax=Knipowitschia caucasica TaxID=637954 RepID=A0AAV2KY05_KNICA
MTVGSGTTTIPIRTQPSDVTTAHALSAESCDTGTHVGLRAYEGQYGSCEKAQTQFKSSQPLLGPWIHTNQPGDQ